MSSEKLETVHVINEIQDLQYDMQQWIRGEIEKDFEIISKRQAMDLTVISSTGKYQTRSEFNSRYEKYFGKYQEAKLSADIIRTKRISDSMIMVVYKQLSEIGKDKISRTTTAIFRFKLELKNNAEWIHVHVTIAK